MTVDALFTAVTARDERLLDECEKRLRAHNESGKLPGPAWDALSAKIARSRAGDWQRAAESLYDFMKGQRREGVLEHAHEKNATKAPKGKGK